MNIHTSHDIALTLEAEQTPPVFIPLVELSEGSVLLESQSFLVWEGVPGPVAMRPVVAPAGTAMGTPATPLAAGALFHATAGTVPLGLAAGLPDLRPLAGVLGVTIDAGGTQPEALPAGARLVGRVAMVTGAV